MSASPHPLQFSIAGIQESQGLSTNLQVSPALLLDSPVEGGKLEEPVEVGLEFSVGGDLILLQAKVSGAWSVECSRCLAQHRADFSAETEDTFPIGGEAIDVTADLRDAVLIELPQRSLCRPDCKGLCSSCGQNLNEKDCACAASREDSIAAEKKNSPFEALKKLKK